MRGALLTVLAALAATAAGIATPNTHVLHEKRNAPLKHWTKRSKVDSKHVLPMRIGLKQSNVHNGVADRLMDEVSRHDSPRYGQWYSEEEINDLFAPAQEAVESVKAWLSDSGVDSKRVSLSRNKQWIQFNAMAEEAEKLLKTEYNIYDHETGGSHVGCDEYHVPSHLTEHIDFVKPGITLFRGGRVFDGEEVSTGKAKRGFRTSGNANFSQPIVKTVLDKAVLPTSDASALAQCDQYITPPCIAAMYNITKATHAAAGNQLGIFEEGDFYSATDLAEFFLLVDPSIPVTTQPKVEGIDGGIAPGLVAGGESNLDLMISYPIIYPQNSIIYQTDDFFYASGLEGGGGFLNTFLDAIDGSYCTYSAYGETGDASIDPKYPDPIPLGYEGQRQCGVYKPQPVISISYGEQEDDLPTNYQQRQCSEFMKLGMRGTSVVIASGDSGVAARSTDDGNSDGCLGHGEVFNPDFPASCPYVTAAGATYLPPGGQAQSDQEVAVSRFPSGGGFSNIYPTPDYQNSTVQAYFANHNPPYKYYSTSGTNNPPETTTNGGLYNRAGRGYPDISAVGDNVVVVVAGAPELIGGTSASAPVFAAILNRINEERIAAGKSTVGFVNPTLYQHPEAFHDITSGNNTGCNTAGFFSVPGWDPVTGLGTPNYPALLNVFMGLP